MEFYIYICVDDGQTPFEIHVKTYIPSKLTEAVDDPLFKLLKLAAPGPDFNVKHQNL
jgi:hypothetical protein